jgi:hypothetical protein
MDQAQLQKMFGGAPGTPVPQVDPEDVRAVWKLGQQIKKDHPGENVGIGVEIFERTCKPGSNIPVVTYRAGMIALFLRPYSKGGPRKIPKTFRSCVDGTTWPSGTESSRKESALICTADFEFTGGF